MSGRLRVRYLNMRVLNSVHTSSTLQISLEDCKGLTSTSVSTKRSLSQCHSHTLYPWAAFYPLDFRGLLYLQTVLFLAYSISLRHRKVRTRRMEARDIFQATCSARVITYSPVVLETQRGKIWPSGTNTTQLPVTPYPDGIEYKRYSLAANFYTLCTP